MSCSLFQARILAMKPEGANARIIARPHGGTPDGIAVHPVRRLLYVSDMGRGLSQPNGFIESFDFDGSHRT
jgi:sugar lactone lactonase YvrE